MQCSQAAYRYRVVRNRSQFFLRELFIWQHVLGFLARVQVKLKGRKGSKPTTVARRVQGS